MKHLLLIAVALLTVASALAQSTTSPYSKQGYGLLNDNASGLQRQMGGVGYAMKNGRVINAMNPASYSAVDSLTFLWDIGVTLNNTWSTEDDKHGHDLSGGLDYLRAHFKLAKRLGASFGLVPFSTVSYSYTADIGDPDLDYFEGREGSGGISQLYLGVGYEPLKNLSVGANVSYMFGTITNTSTAVTTSLTTYQRVLEVRDWNINLGLQYALPLSANDRVVLGLAWTPRKSMHGHAWGSIVDSQDSKPDTVGYTSLSGLYEQPHTFGAGLSYNHGGQWFVETDFTYQNWNKVKYQPIMGFETETWKFDNRWKASVGLQYSPNRRGSYFGAMAFRVGGFYNHDYLNIAGNNVRDYGASIGLGLPVPGGKTVVNLGFEYMHRTSSPIELISENHFNITLGVNFNELWFWKNKIR